MAVILALPRLYDAVVARFALEGPFVTGSTPVPQAFGWRDVYAQFSGPRIVWTPGDDGDLGEVSAAKQPGRYEHGRPLATLDELFTVTISSADDDSPASERAQYQAARELFDAWYRAVYLEARGTFTMGKPSWVRPARKEFRHGAAIQIVCSVQAMIPDTVHDVLAASTGAVDLAISVLDTTEQLTVDSEEI